MPEGVEIEFYRRSAEAAIGRPIARVQANDEWFLKAGLTRPEIEEAATGRTVTAARRRGKLLILDLDDGARIGLRFGMTGRLLVDNVASIEYLEYSSQKNDPKWDRFILWFADGGDLRIRDPRRLGGVALEPDEEALGIDAFSITPGQFKNRVAVGDVPLKARLLDQARIAGVGNLIADELLWRSGFDPARAAGSLQDDEVKRMVRHLRKVLADFMRDGGSHTGRLQPSRVREGTCPKDGATLLRREIGGRTTYSCPQHQR